jgi:copper chaperone NosL
MRKTVIAALTCLGLWLAACDGQESAQAVPPPVEPTRDAIGHYCGMVVVDHAGPKGQIFLKSRPEEPVWFTSARDTIAFTMLPEEPDDILAIYVNDMGRAKSWNSPEPGTWTDARKAWYVIGSNRRGGMGAPEAVPFANEADARTFAGQQGGEVVPFDRLPRDYILGEAPNEPETAPAEEGTAPGPAAPSPDAAHGSGHQ